MAVDRLRVLLLVICFVPYIICDGAEMLRKPDPKNVANDFKDGKISPVVGSGGAQNTKTQSGLGGAPDTNEQKILSQQKARKSNFRLAETKECGTDVIKFCSSYKAGINNNFVVLECLQKDSNILEELSPACQNFIWQYKRNLTLDDRFEYAANQVCKSELSLIQECSSVEKGQGHVIPCLVENMERIKEENCRKYIMKMANIVFSDFRLINNFINDCGDSIQKLQCGRLDNPTDSQSLHNQGKTLYCLSRNISKVDTKCRKQILRVAELQANDYHRDRALYYACRSARELFCADTAAGNGRIYNCLFKKKFDPRMPLECQEKLTVRQKLIAEDVKIDHSFIESCRTSIRKNRCFANKEDTEGLNGDFKRAIVLVCLENSVKRDETSVTPECKTEMENFRVDLMEDYEIDPLIMTSCTNELRGPCKNKAKQGKTLHCLMDLAKESTRQGSQRDPEDTITPQCIRALEELLLEADIDSDYTVDRNLMQACQPVVSALCEMDKNNEEETVLDCLMNNLDSEHMTDICEEKLMEIQYFIARDYRLDHTLYKHCHKDAVNLCSAPEDWFDPRSNAPNMSPLVLPCLYGHMKTPSQSKVSNACNREIKRIMKLRATKVELDPDIEIACIRDLGSFCSEPTDLESGKFGKGEELACLQDNFDSLSEDCQEIVANRTVDESEDLDMDHLIMKHCHPMMKLFCSDELQDGEAEDVLECLIDNKNKHEMNPKCYAAIEHHQLVSMRDFKFNHKFKEACKESVQTFCRGRKKKQEVISCLSEHVRNDTLLERKHRIAKRCRKQLRVEILEKGNDMKLNPDVEERCSEDIRRICSRVESSEVMECLKSNVPKLSPRCKKVIFTRQKEDVLIGDYKLNQACKSMIMEFCDDVVDREGDVLHCLEKNKDMPNFDATCKSFVKRRQEEQNKDYRLNPTLLKSCKLDIPKFCRNITQGQTDDKELEGKVIHCLRKQFIIKRLSASCTDVIRDIIKDSALNYLEDPVLASACEEDINFGCGEEHEAAQRTINQAIKEDGKGSVIECLKKRLQAGKIKKGLCQREVARLAQEAHVDIQVDPILHTACIQDIRKYCMHLSPGNGKQMNCLLIELEDRPNGLTSDCKNRLQARKSLWEYSVKVAPPETLMEVMDSIVVSPAKNYILGIICLLLGVIFIVGITCGRVTKRPKGDKNR